LGAQPLAAMSFCFPITFVVLSITMGIGIGTTSVLARVLGEGDRSRVRVITTHALILALSIVVVVAGLGLSSIDLVFSAMGARGETLALIHEYMDVWYFGVGFLVVPMVGNSALLATGDTKSPSVIMMVAGVVNLILDPPLIFGWGPFPQLGLRGAAIATLISWTTTFGAALYLLARRERMIDWSLPRPREVWHSWRRILYVGLPAAATNLLVPLSTAVLTRFVAEYGERPVAAYGVGGRLESLAMIGINALSTALTPFIGQNYGAHQCERIRDAVYFARRASLTWGFGAALFLGVFASPLARIFNGDADIVSTSIDYLRIIPISYGLLGIGMLVNTIFTALGKPAQASALVAVRLFVLALPLAYLGRALLGLEGIFIGIAVGNGLTAAFAWFLIRRELKQVEDLLLQRRQEEATTTSVDLSQAASTA
ncbi:MAG: MATE family efflux transporter, partial [Myxococcota bacterium]